MKIIKRIGIVLLGIIILMLLIGIFLPSELHIERSIIVKSNSKAAFELINDLTKWKKWSPWYFKDTTLVYTYSEVTVGKDAWFTWNSENQELGSGKMTIIESNENILIKTKLEMNDWGTSFAEFIFKESGQEVTIVWTMHSDNGWNLIGRWFSLFMESMLIADYDAGLLNLKRVLESEKIKETVAGFDVVERMLDPLTYLHIQVKNSDVANTTRIIGENFFKLDEYMKLNGIKAAGYPFTIWYATNEFSCGIPIKDSTIKETDIFKKAKLPSGKAMVISYYGAYTNIAEVYRAAETYLIEKQLTPSAPSIELYVTDPMLEKDTSKWLTELIFPVK